ncbi:MAG: response regulator [Firmicutes bacterium HGW-Firmicutes-15]|nr:MAG: response regulator [Firmicutes bacterium HGW-Firmicutes-15]
MKILTVDDSTIMRKMIVKGVQNMGYEILEAHNAQEGLSVLSVKYKEIKLILLDWNMPGMNGMEFLKRIKAPGSIYGEIPVIMVTTEGERASIVQAIQMGAANYILKPFETEELTKKISVCLEGKV